MASKKKIGEWNKILFLNWKKAFLVLVLEFASIMLHNLVFAVFGFEEALFFIIAIFVIPAYFVAASVFTVVDLIGKTTKINR